MEKTNTDSGECCALLEQLIAFRTVNPGGDEFSLCNFLANALRNLDADQVEVAELPREAGTGGYVFARFGHPRLLINVHLDTVPVNAGWSRDPFRATYELDRLYGLGAADTKGAIACVLTALRRCRPTDTAILFSGDEELGTSCIRAFVESPLADGITHAVVCEPTSRRAGIRHRGVRAYHASIEGEGGHSSKADHLPKPIVTLARLAIALDELGKDYLDRGPTGMRGLCMNVASLEGGVAFNVVPEKATLGWSLRPPPDFDDAHFDKQQEGVVLGVDPAIKMTSRLAHAPFACRDHAFFQNLIGSHVQDFVSLDFWTEAAVLSAAGIDAVVVGPGDIAQAHAADEFVTVEDLKWATQMFADVFEATHE